MVGLTYRIVTILTTTPAPLRLKKKEARRLRAGHDWVFSNEVDTAQTPLNGYEPGQDVEVLDDAGKFLGYGYVNPHSLICARLMSRNPAYPITESLLVHRLKVALSLRDRLFDHPYYRLAYGESDGLPGVIIDRFGDVYVLQLTTAGMERRRQALLNAMVKVLKPTTVILRNDTAVRALEGLDSYVDVAIGQAPDQLNVIENHARFHADPMGGQKTGWFYDHRLNRARMTHFVKGRRVLDVFSYLGAWGIPAALAGASEVLCVDESETALAGLEVNAKLNDVSDRMSAIQGNAFDVLKQLRESRQRFDVIILDPPAFIRRKKDVEKGTEAYRHLNQMAIQLLERDGILVSASCSYHLERQTLKTLLGKTARHLDRDLTILEQGHQGPDHPVHPAIAETEYLKAFTCRVLPRS